MSRDSLPAEEALFLDGPAGRLEALYRPARGETRTARTALLCHPHPLYGGTMANKTLYRIARQLALELAVPSLRFNFRGAGRSQGEHQEGRGEREDTLAALEDLALRHPGASISVVGFSFGAVVGLRAGTADERVDSLVALGLPLDGDWSLDFLDRTRKPRLFVHGERDEFTSVSSLRRYVDGLPPPTELHVIEEADHLFRGREDAAVETVVGYIRRLDDRSPS